MCGLITRRAFPALWNVLFHFTEKPLSDCGRGSFMMRKSLFRKPERTLSSRHKAYLVCKNILNYCITMLYKNRPKLAYLQPQALSSANKRLSRSWRCMNIHSPEHFPHIYTIKVLSYIMKVHAHSLLSCWWIKGACYRVHTVRSAQPYANVGTLMENMCDSHCGFTLGQCRFFTFPFFFESPLHTSCSKYKYAWLYASRWKML